MSAALIVEYVFANDLPVINVENFFFKYVIGVREAVENKPVKLAGNVTDKAGISYR